MMTSEKKSAAQAQMTSEKKSASSENAHVPKEASSSDTAAAQQQSAATSIRRGSAMSFPREMEDTDWTQRYRRFRPLDVKQARLHAIRKGAVKLAVFGAMLAGIPHAVIAARRAIKRRRKRGSASTHETTPAKVSSPPPPLPLQTPLPAPTPSSPWVESSPKPLIERLRPALDNSVAVLAGMKRGVSELRRGIEVRWHRWRESTAIQKAAKASPAEGVAQATLNLSMEPTPLSLHNKRVRPAESTTPPRTPTMPTRLSTPLEEKENIANNVDQAPVTPPPTIAAPAVTSSFRFLDINPIELYSPGATPQSD